MDRSSVVRLLGFLAGAYPSFKVTDPVIEAWTLVLADDDAKAIQAAALRHVRAGTPFPPLLSDLCKNAAEIEVGAPAPEIAWSEVERWRRIARRAFETQSSYTMGAWSHPLIGEAIEALGGWGAVVSEDNSIALRAHFMRIYGVSRDVAVKGENYGTAAGLPEGEDKDREELGSGEPGED